MTDRERMAKEILIASKADSVTVPSNGFAYTNVDINAIADYVIAEIAKAESIAYEKGFLACERKYKETL